MYQDIMHQSNLEKYKQSILCHNCQKQENKLKNRQKLKELKDRQKQIRCMGGGNEGREGKNAPCLS